MKDLKVKVLSNAPIASGIYRMEFALPEETEGMRCGKFLNISVGDGAHLLRRPIAICEYEKDRAAICYQIKGEGTKKLSEKRAGDELFCLLPLGNGFVLSDGWKKIALVGGGVGVFPMYSVLKEYENADKIFYTFLGFRNAGAVCMEEEFSKLSRSVQIVTDDGSYKKKSNAVAAFFDAADSGEKFDAILSCGPVPMLRALKEGMRARGLEIPCFVSLEERMGCGVGACLVCVCKRQGGKENARVCKDGPVFSIDEVEI